MTHPQISNEILCPYCHRYRDCNTLVLDTLKNEDILCIPTNFLVVFLKINGEMWVTVEVDGFIELFCSSVIKFIGKFFVCNWNTPTKSNGFDLVHM